MTQSLSARTLGCGISVWLLLASQGVRSEEEYGDRRKVPRNPQNACEVADSNLQKAGDAILRDAQRPLAVAGGQRWDKRTTPKYLDQFERRFTLRPSERALLYKQGMVSLARLSFESYVTALHEIYQSQLPLYVSIDALLHAVYASNDGLMADLEERIAVPNIIKFLTETRAKLPSFQQAISADTAHDLDLYLTVAARLLGDKHPPLFQVTENEASSLLAQIRSAKDLTGVSLFGRPRMIDFSQYAPRGHYAAEPQMTALFQTAMWLSRLEFNLVSRSSRSSAPGTSPDPRETPREVALALALANLMQQANVTAEVRALDELWSFLAGRREDVSLPELLVLQKQAGITDLRAESLADKLRTAIGNRFARTVSMHYMPQGSVNLPVIATVLGPRVVSDAQRLRPLVHDAVPDKYRLHFSEVAYALGHDRALSFLTPELAKFPSLKKNLDLSRTMVSVPSPAQPRTDLYSAWLGSVETLAAKPSGVHPSYMDSDAYADLRINSTAAGYAQIKHNYVLVAGQPYDLGGCEIPDGYVEPAPETLRGLREYARRGVQAATALDPEDKTAARSYFQRLDRLLAILSVIVDDELAGRTLTANQKRFLSMVVEMAPGSSGGPPTFTGWYFDLFRKRAADGLGRSQLVADYYTSTNLGEASYVGIADVRLGLFVVDTNGGPRIMTGPIARAYETHQPMGGTASRLDDLASGELPETARKDPWAQSYTVAAPTDIPSLLISYDPDASPDIAVETEAPVSDVTITLLDHHRQPLASLQRSFPKGKTVFRFPARSPSGRSLVGSQVHGLSVRRGEFFTWKALMRAGMENGIYLPIGPKSKN